MKPLVSLAGAALLVLSVAGCVDSVRYRVAPTASCLRGRGVRSLVVSSEPGQPGAVGFTADGYHGGGLFLRDHDEADFFFAAVSRNIAASVQASPAGKRDRVEAAYTSKNYVEHNVIVTWGGPRIEMLPKRLRQLLHACLRT